MASLVSVIMPAYNAQNFISEAIEAVIFQTYRNLELIIVDDGSIDKTFDICLDYAKRYTNIKLLTHLDRRNKGVSRSRRLAVEKSRGNYIAFCDADDIFLPNKIEMQVSKLEQHKHIAMCHSAIKLNISSNKNEDFLKNFNLFDKEYIYSYNKQSYFLKQNRICNSTVLVRGEYLKDLDFSSIQLFQYEDWLTWVLLSTKGQFLYLANELIEYRYHKESATYLVNTQPLKKLYSQIEFYLLILLKSENISYKLKSLYYLYRTLRRLYSAYKKR